MFFVWFLLGLVCGLFIAALLPLYYESVLSKNSRWE